MATLVDDVQWALERSYTSGDEFAFSDLKDKLEALDMSFTKTSLYNVLYRLQLKGVLGKNGRNAFVYTPESEIKDAPVVRKGVLTQTQEDANLRELDTKEDLGIPQDTIRAATGQDTYPERNPYIDTPQGRLHVDVDGTIWLSQKVGQL